EPGSQPATASGPHGHERNEPHVSSYLLQPLFLLACSVCVSQTQFMARRRVSILPHKPISIGNTRMKMVLMIAYHYPPEGSSSGVLRTLKFSKYLIQHGWMPHILTLRESFYSTTDKALLQPIPSEAFSPS